MIRRAVLLLLSALLVLPVAAGAHHGWESFNTARPWYFEGTIEKVRWGAPHPEIVLVVPAGVSLPDPDKIVLPPELQKMGFRATLKAATLSPTGRWTLDLPPVDLQRAWGLSTPPKVGSKLAAVGFFSCDEVRVARAAVLWLEDGRGVRQLLDPPPEGCKGEPKAS